MPLPLPGGHGPLVGRVEELALIDASLDAASDRGSALMFRGHVGIGKSALLNAARVAAQKRGLTVLSAEGVAAGAYVTYAGIHQLLPGLWGGVDALPTQQRAALLSALDANKPHTEEMFPVALAVFRLLAAEASRQPVLVVIDDLQWFDAASLHVVGFIGRRLEADPIVLLATVCEPHTRETSALGLREHVVGPLDRVSAEAILDVREPRLAPSTRRRLLDDAAGNPLALNELSMTAEPSADLSVLPVSVRLQEAFAFGLGDLPPVTATLLLVLAADGMSSLAEILAATELVLERSVTIAALQPAADAGLVTIDATKVHFRHPLVRSAVYQSASVESRRAAHRALATVTAGEPDRNARHRADAAEAPDEQVARDLDAVGHRALARGAVLHASAAFARAADLGADSSMRARRLLWAAEPAFEAGRADLVHELVERARQEELNDQDQARVTWLSEIVHDGLGTAQGDPSRVLHLVELGRGASRAGDVDLAMSLLMAASLRTWWEGTDPETARRIVADVADLAEPSSIGGRLVTIARADHLGHGREIAGLVDAMSSAGGLDARSAHLVGQAAHCVGDVEGALRMSAIAMDRLREEGRLTLLAQALVLRSVDSVVVGDFSIADAAAREGLSLAEETDQPIWQAMAAGSLAAAAGVCGDDDAADAFLAQGLDTLERAGTRASLAWLQIVRGLVHLSAGRCESAYAELSRVFDPGDAAHHRFDQFLGAGLVAEAAAGCDAVEPARELMTALAALAGPSSASGLRAGLLHARPLLAPDQEAEGEYRAALRSSSLVRPFDRARLQFAYGMWLRRHRRVVDSRQPLRVAVASLGALGASQWAERARQELRASGGSTVTKKDRPADVLSPQELQIAELAAEGLSNREIGERLYLSHRTVASHLYRVFPKLGITSRTELNRVLSSDAGD